MDGPRGKPSEDRLRPVHDGNGSPRHVTDPLRCIRRKRSCRSTSTCLGRLSMLRVIDKPPIPGPSDFQAPSNAASTKLGHHRVPFSGFRTRHLSRGLLLRCVSRFEDPDGSRQHRTADRRHTHARQHHNHHTHHNHRPTKAVPQRRRPRQGRQAVSPPHALASHLHQLTSPPAAAPAPPSPPGPPRPKRQPSKPHQRTARPTSTPSAAAHGPSCTPSPRPTRPRPRPVSRRT